jgi:hypothetical protein
MRLYLLEYKNYFLIYCLLEHFPISIIKMCLITYSKKLSFVLNIFQCYGYVLIITLNTFFIPSLII